MFALKFVNTKVQNRDEILRECALNKVLISQYIVRLEDVIEWNDRLFLFFELMERDMFKLGCVKSEAFCKFTIY